MALSFCDVFATSSCQPLDAARRHLQLHPGATVGDTALAFGFGHAGRFSHYYEARFGELPSETSARAFPQRRG